MVGPGVYVRMRQEGGFWFKRNRLDIGDIYILPSITRATTSSIESYHRSSIRLNPLELEMTQFTEPNPVEAFDFANRRFLTRDLPNFRAYIKYIPDMTKKDAFCVLLLKLEDQPNQPPQLRLYLLHSDVWTREVAGRYFPSTDQLVDHSILLADKTDHGTDGSRQIKVGNYLCSASFETVEAQGEPVHEVTMVCAEKKDPEPRSATTSKTTHRGRHVHRHKKT
ncbi:hypothetical protein PG991_003029 [Apiospora marii]|uniref:Uncharacterized protein n=1 Tax=Apiospora marii TaxID=335849 RepID=A0ABR1SH52_9PEZI